MISFVYRSEHWTPILQACVNCKNMHSDKKRTTQVAVLQDFFIDDLHIHMKFLCQTGTAQKFMAIFTQKAQADADLISG